MAFAPPVKARASTNLANSAWTPMNHPEANLQVFEERRELIKKWFHKWQDPQKRIVVDDILRSLSNKHLVSLHETINKKFPEERHDFTRVLPRVLTLYLFSFLDPRTLCRCAQVSWYWNYLTEMDCLWRPKCLKFGWYPTYQPSPFEEKIWKRFYVNTVHELNFTKAKSPEAKPTPSHEVRPDTARSNVSKMSVARSTTSTVTGLKKGPTVPSTKKPLSAPKWQPPPWKGSDPHPIDTVRYNYLDNMTKNKKKISSPDSRPSSKQGRRPRSSVDRAGRSKDLDAAMSKMSISTGMEDTRRSYNAPLDKTANLSGTTLARYANSASLSSPRLNKDFQLPHYNGNNVAANTGKQNAAVMQQMSITSQVNWSPQNTQTIGDPLSRSPDRPLSSYGRVNGRATGDRSVASSSDFVRKSLDAGVRPHPVSKFTPEKTKRIEVEAPQEKKVTPAKHDQSQAAGSLDDLKGKGWSAPAHSNSDDEF